MKTTPEIRLDFDAEDSARLDRLAERRGITVEELVADLLRTVTREVIGENIAARRLTVERITAG